MVLALVVVGQGIGLLWFCRRTAKRDAIRDVELRVARDATLAVSKAALLQYRGDVGLREEVALLRDELALRRQLEQERHTAVVVHIDERSA